MPTTAPVDGSRATMPSTRSARSLRLLAVHAHPDDESSKGAASLARYAHAGAGVLVATCTGGERGSILNPRLVDDPELNADLAAARRREMAAAAAALGVRHVWLGFVDSGYPEPDLDGARPPLPERCFASLPLEQAAAPLVELVRQFRPQVVVTYDENGGYPHPDHVMTHRVAVEAFEAAGDPRRYPGASAPWTPSKLYYVQTFSRPRIQALHEAIVSTGRPSPYADRLAAWGDRPDRRVTTRVPVADFFDQRDAALRAHASQVDPDGGWFAVPRDIERRVWPTEDYELAASRVPVAVEEDDLFAGVR